ncbi:hypothetical protein B0H14DRAFT_1266639 [Mycena olivaceomarginata]|nr:hypothetical protein B0H14DRAFT_1266639 [Mycena olivaceomarginata]
MHSSIHSLAHRAPPATRSRVRWQPYNALASASTSSISSRSPSISYLSTPATSVSSSPPPKATPLCETERLKAHPSMPQTPRDPSNSLRETPKNKYATGLVDQAVKSLCEIWRPQDIPTVFLTSSRATVGSCDQPPPPPPKSRRRNTQLPSPVSPLTRPSPPSPIPATSPECARTGSTTLQCDQDLAAGFGNRSNLVPIKGFVHEVLRRSRTSGSVLQTALCYLEAVRPKVPELVRKEQSGEGSRSEYDSESRVTPATAAELEFEAQLSSSLDIAAPCRNEEDVMDTVRVYDNEDIASTATPSSATNVVEDQNKQQKSDTPSTPLPSPLLCPRRAFLASLILASKFTQDKCYSNRAWAKLSGLPAREIGRCERALGDALDWRLWVGKTPVASHSASAASNTSTPAPAATGRPVVRCRSEGTLPGGKGAFLARNEQRESTNTVAASSPVSSRPARTRGLRRCSTLPADAFADKDRSSSSSNDLNSASSSGSGPIYYGSTWNGEGHQLSFSNIAQQDQLMGSPVTSSPPSPSSSYSQQYPSPVPSTPSLSYSPSSTESSSGDRTIQMSTFMDDNMVPLSHDVVVVSCGNEMSSNWATHSSPTLSGIAFEAALGPNPMAFTGMPSAFLGVPSKTAQPSLGHVSVDANAWPWSDVVASDDYTPAPLEYAVLGAAAVPGKFPSMPAMPAFRGVDVGLGYPGAVFAADGTFTSNNYHSHTH